MTFNDLYVRNQNVQTGFLEPAWHFANGGMELVVQFNWQNEQALKKTCVYRRLGIPGTSIWICHATRTYFAQLMVEIPLQQQV